MSSALIFLAPGSAALEVELRQLLERCADTAKPPPDPVDLRLADFDDTHYRLQVTSAEPRVVRLSMIMPAFKEIDKLNVGLAASLTEVYGPSFVAAPGHDADVELRFDRTETAPVAEVATPTGSSALSNAETIATSASLLRRHVLAAPFLAGMRLVAAGQSATGWAYRLRPSDEAIFIVPRADRLVVVFALTFPDVMERAMARVLAQEFVEASRRVSGAPPAIFTEAGMQAPAEVRALPLQPPTSTATATDAAPGDRLGYLSLALSLRHFDTPTRAESVATQLAMFRTGLGYHIKAAKSAMHARMRGRADDWLAVLQHATPDDEEPTASATSGGSTTTTASGRAFVRKV